VIDTILKLIAVVLLMFCAFFFGGLAMDMNLSPAKLIKTPIAVTSTLLSATQIESCNGGRWQTPVPVRTGLLSQTNPSDTSYTLYTSTHDTTARLIDNHGQEVHTWSFQYHDLFKDTSHIVSIGKLKNQYFYLRDFHLYENGDIILMISAGGVTPWGMGFVKLDKNSNVLWTYTGYVNNDFDIGDDGIIYTIEHEMESVKPARVRDVFLPFLEDHIVMLDNYGREQKRISLIDALDKSPYAAILNRFVNDGHGDPTHSNSITYIKTDNPNVPWMKQGHLLISVRNLNSFLVLDPKTETITHVADLPSRMQHDIDITQTGNLLMFDNQGDILGNEHTRILEIDPITHQTVWQWDKDAMGKEMQSDFFGEQHRSSNGNTFIVYAEKGQLFEIDKNNQVTWAYHTPLQKNIDGENKMAIITSAERFPSTFIKFIDQYCYVPIL
jgi:hypothetical protein